MYNQLGKRKVILVKNKIYTIVLMLLLSLIVTTVGLANPTEENSLTYNFSFMDEDISVVLHTLAKISNVNMVIDDSIKGNVTMRMNDVTFDTALNVITSAKGLSYRKIGNSFIIEPSDMGVTDVIKLQYTRAVDIKKTIEPIATNLKLKIEIDEVSNSLLITGSPTGCARIKEMLKSIDVLQQQVTLEAKVVAINKSNMKDLGIDWSWDQAFKYPEQTTEDTLDATGKVVSSKVTTTREKNVGTIKFGSSPIPGVPYEFYYQAKVSALISNGNAKILASPKVTTINGKEARVLIGDRIPVLTETMSDGKTSTTVEYIDAGIKLAYTPSITADGTITAKVRTEVSTPTLVADIKNYRITTREAESTVNMKDGETMVIAGLIGSEESKTMSKVPFLGDLPLIGALFRSEHTSKSETEVIIFLTAKIVK